MMMTFRFWLIVAFGGLSVETQHALLSLEGKLTEEFDESNIQNAE